MTRFDVAVLSLRLFALYVWLQTGLQFSRLAYLMATGLKRTWQAPTEVLGWLLSILLLLGLGWAVFALAPSIGRRIFPGSEPVSSATRPEIGTLGLKVCALLVIARFLEDLSLAPTSWKLAAEIYGWNSGHARLVSIALTGVIGVALFFSAPRLARRLFGASSAPLDETLLAHIQAVSFSILGAYLFINSLSPIALYVAEGNYKEESALLDFRIWAHVAGAVLGLALLLGGGGLSRFWLWLHRAGLSIRPEQPG